MTQITRMAGTISCGYSGQLRHSSPTSRASRRARGRADRAAASREVCTEPGMVQVVVRCYSAEAPRSSQVRPSSVDTKMLWLVATFQEAGATSSACGSPGGPSVRSQVRAPSSLR